MSFVTIRKLPVESEFWLPISKRQLTATISCENIYLDNKLAANTGNIKYDFLLSIQILLTSYFRNAPKSPVLLFWTPDYWYRPKSAKDAYHELQNHLSNILKNHQYTRKRIHTFETVIYLPYQLRCVFR